jgi:hypothetical protein
MAKGALKTPVFGEWLRKKRGKQSLGEFAIQVRRHAAPLGLKFDRSQVEKIEAGRIPSVPILEALAPVLGVTSVMLQARVVAELKGERADAAHDGADYQNSRTVTSSGTQVEVKETPHEHPLGGTTHGDRPAAGTTNRVSESEAARDAELQDNIQYFLRRGARLRELQQLVDRLRASADDVRAVADLLQPGPADEDTRTQRPDAAPGDAGSPRKGKKGR